MISPNEDSGPIQFEPLASLPASTATYQPYGTYVQLEYSQPESVGGIILPQKAKGLEWVRVKVVSAGNDCKLVKAGDTVLLASQAIMVTRADGQVASFTQEDKILAVVK